MKQIQFLILIILLLPACSKPTNNSNKIRKIDFAMEGIAINIDSSLTYNYYSCSRNNNLKGFYKGKVTMVLWDSLNTKLNLINFDTLKEVDCRNEFDPGIELLIKNNKNPKHFISNVGCLPSEVKSIFYWIANTYKYVKLTKVKDSIKFDVQIRCPPINNGNVKFPAPFKKRHFHK